MTTLTFTPELRAFCEVNHLPPEDCLMLMQVHYRGDVPKTVEDWWYVYSAIVLVLDGKLPTLPLEVQD